MHGWQSESIDGPKGGCVFWSGCSGHLTHNCRMCGVAKRNVIVVVVVVSTVSEKECISTADKPPVAKNGEANHSGKLFNQNDRQGDTQKNGQLFHFA